MNWDDLRVALAVHHSGSYAGAGARLKIDETTVARRLARLQRDLGMTLFEAVDGVRKPTPRCLEVLARAEQFAIQVDRVKAFESPGDGPVGRCRIATTDSLAAEVLAPQAPDFLTANPGLTLQFLASTENVNFSRWEADVAIRLQKPDRGDFVLSKLGEFGFYLFEPRVLDGAAAEALVCAYPDDLEDTPESHQLAAAGLWPKARCRTKNLIVIKALLRSGGCSAILPTFMAADLLEQDGLRATKLDATREVWLLVQDHLKGDPAVRAVIDWVRSCFAKLDC